MSSNTRSHRFLSRSLAMAVAVACGFGLSSAAQAQMVAGSGCTNCGGSSGSVATYGTPMATQYSQPMATQSYASTSYPSEATFVQSYPSGSYSGCSNTWQRCSSSHQSAGHHRHASNSCGACYSNTSMQSNNCGCSGSVSYPAAGSYSSGNSYAGGSYSGGSYAGGNVMQVSTPMMQTGAGCAGGNCR